MTKGLESPVRDKIEIEPEMSTIDGRDSVTGTIEFHQGCEEEQCKRSYNELKNNMKRIWDLETEEEVKKLENSYYPHIRSQREKEAEELMLRQLKQLPSGQYQTGLMWSGKGRPVSNWAEAQAA